MQTELSVSGVTLKPGMGNEETRNEKREMKKRETGNEKRKC